MKDKQSPKYFAETLRLSLNFLQLFKYNLQAFKESEQHKAMPPDKDMRVDIANMQNAINAFMGRVKLKCKGTTFSEIVKDMTSDRVHDLSSHMEAMYAVDNIEDWTNLLKEEFERQKQEKLNTSNVAA